MAFDQTTRNRLNRFVADARKLLANEFTRQLQAIYGMNPITGDVADIKTLMGLTPSQQESAQLLRDTFEHYLVISEKGKEKERKLTALDRIVREQAFTVLNRIAALRMSEARGFLIESIANGYESKGFQLFHRIAGTSLGEAGDAYRHYLFSIFDEFSLDLSVLFDRFSVQGRLFPSTPILIELLNLVNDDEVAPLWFEDETIGWIYQYFNSQEERKKMRDASQAPRNSRELAVRNQFFTPRYVVEFLTDNTLGRIWYEMTQGKTKLVDECEYLVRRPNEIFLAKNEKTPELEVAESLSQEGLLNQTVYIEHRELKDPRDIKMLDPACGSMHFGLYCFDLFERIYEEAWDIEISQGSDSFLRESNSKPLTETYSDKAEFSKQIPRLIIENNIHGVDIDPRAAQVAGLSLWQRAHNSWQQAGIKPQQRPQILRSNIVCAEPMPGEKELLQEFTSQLKPTVLGQLVEVIFEKMQLAGEAGTLLKIEKEIDEAIAGAKAVWHQQNQALDRFPDLANVAKNRGEMDFDVSDIDDEGFWQKVEQKILDALAMYTSSSSPQESGIKRLFASDTSKGFAFIELRGKTFDVILMNPPFGSVPKQVIPYLKSTYPNSYYDIYSAFVDGLYQKLSPEGCLGAITSKTFFSSTRLLNFRKWMITKAGLAYCADLGKGILDNATVETSAYVIDSKNKHNTIDFYDLQRDSSKEKLLACTNGTFDKVYTVEKKSILEFPNYSFSAYWGSLSLRSIFNKYPNIKSGVADTAQGQATGDDFRFVRTRWELPLQRNKYWKVFAKGGEFFRYFCDWPLLVNWGREGVTEYKKLTLRSVLISSRSQDFEDKVAVVWNRVNEKGFNVRVLPKNAKFADKAPAAFPSISPYILLGYFCSSLANRLCSLQNPNRMFEVRDVSSLPVPPLNEQEIEVITKKIINIKQNWNSKFESSSFYIGFPNQIKLVSSLSDFANKMSLLAMEDLNELNSLQEKLDNSVYKSANIEISDLKLLDDVLGSSPAEKLHQNFQSQILSGDLQFWVTELLTYILGVTLGRWDIGKTINIDQPQVFDAFDEQPTYPPGMLLEHSSTNTLPYGEEFELGIVPIDNKFKNNLASYFDELVVLLFNADKNNTIVEINNILNINSFNEFFIKPNCFFENHLKKYTTSRRSSPLYWPLQSLSCDFTLWIYYHKLNNQTLLSCVNNYVDPKLNDITIELSALKSESQHGLSLENKIEELSDLRFEIESYKDELLRLSKFWQPNLSDGVQITAAPLWRLFQHKAWQKKLKETWHELEDGDYDWAHLAFSTWPERVLKKCHADRSLAIAHDVENALWHEVEVIKARKKEPVWEWQPKPLSDNELRAYIKGKISTDERLKLYRSNSTNGGA